MEKEFEIELQDEAAQEETGVQLPMNFLRFGEVQNDDVKVYIKQDVYKALEKLAASDTSKELGSILLGQYCQEHGKTHVIISKHIEAKYTDASAATLTFTHETWEYIHAEHEKKYPDLKIIGWQHTHPNYGIFLSNYDMFIQENFFNLPFQVAYVIDPVQNLRGFFQWKNDRIEKLKGYYIYDEVGKPIKIQQAKPAKEAPAPAKTSRASTVLIALLCALTVCLAIFALSINSKYNRQMEKQEQILTQISSQQAQIQEQKAQIDKQDGLIQEQDATIDALKEDLEKNTEDGTVTFKAYKVKAGDNLYKICRANGLSYKANIKIILAVNGIKNGNQIYVGQTILLPVTK